MATLDPLTGYPVHCVERGYVRLKAPDHPLATRDGVVPRHRLICFDDGFHSVTSGASCHWCGFHLPWRSDLPMASYRVVNVDHLNGVPGDDRPENLIPSCWWCNANRGWGEALEPVWFHNFVRWFASVPPWDRPNLPAIVSEVVGYDVMAAYRQLQEAA